MRCSGDSASPLISLLLYQMLSELLLVYQRHSCLVQLKLGAH